MNALQFLLDYSNASEYEDARDETTNTWLFFANAMEEYHQHRVKNNCVLDDVIVIKGDDSLPTTKLKIFDGDDRLL